MLRLLIEEVPGFQRLPDGLAQVVESVVERTEGRVRVVETGVKEVVGEGLKQVFEIDLGGEVAGVFGVADALHRDCLCFILV